MSFQISVLVLSQLLKRRTAARNQNVVIATSTVGQFHLLPFQNVRRLAYAGEASEISTTENV